MFCLSFRSLFQGIPILHFWSSYCQTLSTQLLWLHSMLMERALQWKTAAKPVSLCLNVLIQWPEQFLTTNELSLDSLFNSLFFVFFSVCSATQCSQEYTCLWPHHKQSQCELGACSGTSTAVPHQLCTNHWGPHWGVCKCEYVACNNNNSWQHKMPFFS